MKVGYGLLIVNKDAARETHKIWAKYDKTEEKRRRNACFKY